MGKMQREKGAAAEREFCKIIMGRFPIKVRRRLEQYQESGWDVSFYRFACEIKRRAKAPVQAALLQTVEKQVTGDSGLVPLVVMRGDGGKWIASLELDDLLDMLDEIKEEKR